MRSCRSFHAKVSRPGYFVISYRTKDIGGGDYMLVWDQLVIIDPQTRNRRDLSDSRRVRSSASLNSASAPRRELCSESHLALRHHRGLMLNFLALPPGPPVGVAGAPWLS